MSMYVCTWVHFAIWSNYFYHSKLFYHWLLTITRFLPESVGDIVVVATRGVCMVETELVSAFSIDHRCVFRRDDIRRGGTRTRSRRFSGERCGRDRAAAGLDKRAAPATRQPRRQSAMVCCLRQTCCVVSFVCYCYSIGARFRCGVTSVRNLNPRGAPLPAPWSHSRQRRCSLFFDKCVILCAVTCVNQRVPVVNRSCLGTNVVSSRYCLQVIF